MMAAEQPDLPEPTRARRWRAALLSGLAGALSVTLLNEGVRRVLPHAPRIDVIGERGLAGVLRAAHLQPPRGAALYWVTLLADLVGNGVYFSAVGLLPHAPTRAGAVLGAAAGVGAVVLPGPLGLGRQPGARSPRTPLLTAAWYFAGGLISGAVYRRLVQTPVNQS